jgi:5'-3' exonuclease
MNQQRSRRFRASKESVEKVDEIARIRDELRSKGVQLPPEKPKGSHFDSNCITPVHFFLLLINKFCKLISLGHTFHGTSFGVLALLHP